jgi:hypothetical protein
MSLSLACVPHMSGGQVNTDDQIKIMINFVNLTLLIVSIIKEPQGTLHEPPKRTRIVGSACAGSIGLLL